MLIDRQDVRYALRSIRRTPLLSAVVVLALSVGIGLNAGVFSVLDSLLLEPSTQVDPASFVQIYPRYEGWYSGPVKDSAFNSEDYDALRTQAHSLADVAAWQNIGTQLDDVHRAGNSTLVTCNAFRVFGIGQPLVGRYFNAHECAPGTAEHIAVLSEHVWRNDYSSDPQIIGKVIHLSRQAVTVVGIMPDRFAGTISGSIWIPYSLQPIFNHGNSNFQNPNAAWLRVAGRLQKGSSRGDATAEIEMILRRQDRSYLTRKVFTLDRKTSVTLTDGSFLQNPAMQSLTFALMGLIMGPLALVLLLACTNVTMLFLSRSVVRRGEIAVRLALGAGRARLMRMLLLESFFTAGAAGVVSIYLAMRFPSLLFGFIDPTAGASVAAMHPNWKVFGLLAALVIVAAAVSAMAPIRESFRFDLITALKGREGSATMRSSTSSALIIVQLAMSFVLLAAAVLFARLPFLITHIDPGFETRQLMTVPLDIEVPPYTATSARVFMHRLDARLMQLPGVQSLAWASVAPFNVAPISEVRVEKQEKGQGKPAAIDNVSAGFFQTFGVRLLYGRGFQGSDASGDHSAQIAVVSRAFAKAFWSDANPIGKVVVTPDERRLTVVGVAEDTQSERFSILDGPRLYTLQDTQAFDGGLFVRFTGDSAPVAAAIEKTIVGMDASQSGTPSTVWDFLVMNATAIRSLAEIILFMAGIAVALAISGVYGVLSFAISQRTREFGIQMMLGATRETIFRSVMARGLRQIGIGIAAGLILAMPAAWAFLRISKNGWMRVDPFSPIVYLVSAAILLMVSLSAMFLPALRATQVDPMQALRND